MAWKRDKIKGSIAYPDFQNRERKNEAITSFHDDFRNGPIVKYTTAGGNIYFYLITKVGYMALVYNTGGGYNEYFTGVKDLCGWDSTNNTFYRGVVVTDETNFISTLYSYYRDQNNKDIDPRLSYISNSSGFSSCIPSLNNATEHYINCYIQIQDNPRTPISSLTESDEKPIIDKYKKLQGWSMQFLDILTYYIPPFCRLDNTFTNVFTLKGHYTYQQDHDLSSMVPTWQDKWIRTSIKDKGNFIVCDIYDTSLFQRGELWRALGYLPLFPNLTPRPYKLVFPKITAYDEDEGYPYVGDLVSGVYTIYSDGGLQSKTQNESFLASSAPCIVLSTKVDIANYLNGLGYSYKDVDNYFKGNLDWEAIP